MATRKFYSNLYGLHFCDPSLDIIMEEELTGKERSMEGLQDCIVRRVRGLSINNETPPIRIVVVGKGSVLNESLKGIWC